MSDAAYMARPQNKATALECLGKHPLAKDELGQYNHDAAIKYTKLIKRELAGMFNMLDSDHGMSKLADPANNFINKIKSTNAYTARDILRESKAKADAESRSLGAVVTPKITARSDAQEEADQKNSYCQAIIGVKEGVTEAFIKAVGSDAIDSVLKDADGSSDKSINDYKLSDLISKPSSEERIVQKPLMCWHNSSKLPTSNSVFARGSKPMWKSSNPKPNEYLPTASNSTLPSSFSTSSLTSNEPSPTNGGENSARPCNLSGPNTNMIIGMTKPPLLTSWRISMQQILCEASKKHPSPKQELPTLSKNN